MVRYLYGASSADFAATLATVSTQDGVVVIAPGISMSVYDSISGSPITNLFSATGVTHTLGTATTTVVSAANGTVPFYGPDGEQGTLYLRASDGSGGYLWYGVNPSDLGDFVVSLTTRVNTLETTPTGFSGDFTDLTNVPSTFPPSTHSHAQADVTGLGTSLAAKVDSGSGPFTLYRVATAGGALPATAPDGSICVRPN